MRAALARLGVDRLVLSIHHASFPAGADDLGHGTPYGDAGAAFAAWIAGLGFDGIALGPAGITSRDNASPYDAVSRTRNPLHLAFGPLVAEGRVDAAALAAAIAGRPATDRVAYRYAWEAVRRLVPDVAEAQARVRAQHAAFAARARALGLRLYADLPIGTAHEERAALAPLCVPGYAMGAPPSRTNPAGQPWGYPVLDPRTLGPGGAGRAVLEARLAELADHDGLRIDHPHGWVCPWVYRTGALDPAAAVRAGARLCESPDLPDHPALAAYARVRPDQLDRARPRYDDAWVRALEPAQVDAYAVVFDRFVDAIRARGGGCADLMVEVLSTCPRPLAAVLARHGLGRFRVTQKARVDEPDDVYRSDNARPEDWIMVGNHDTPPLRAVIDGWDEGARARRAAYLATRLAPPGATAAARAARAARLAGDDAALATAMLAELFVGPARHVLVFWVDLFGSRDVYNRPGVVDEANWSLRVPADFAAAYAAARARGDAPDLGAALAWALAARGVDAGDGLAAALSPGELSRFRV